MIADLTTTELAIAVAGALVVSAYAMFILAPTVSAYGRVWEKVTASLLTLYILGALVGIGGAIGFAILWTYDQYWS